jgi:hypothetical protein
MVRKFSGDPPPLYLYNPGGKFSSSIVKFSSRNQDSALENRSHAMALRGSQGIGGQKEGVGERC